MQNFRLPLFSKTITLVESLANRDLSGSANSGASLSRFRPEIGAEIRKFTLSYFALTINAAPVIKITLKSTK